MAKFTIEFEDDDKQGMKAKVVLDGFKGVTSDNLLANTATQNMYFAINAFLVNGLGLDIPETIANDSDV